MCIGIPMQVVEPGHGFAHCEGLGLSRRVNTLLVGDQSPGTWLLVFLDSAREVISAEDAARIGDAVRALDLAMQDPGGAGGPASRERIDALFADLIDREPQKPASLLALEARRLQSDGE